MRVLVTSAAGANGDGYGALLAFDHSGRPNGVLNDDARIADPRGLVIENGAGLLFLNSGADRVVALDARGKIVRDTGTIDGLNPGRLFAITLDSARRRLRRHRNRSDIPSPRQPRDDHRAWPPADGT